VIDEWNKLPSDIVTSTSVNMFKNTLDDHWNDVGVKSCMLKLHQYQVTK